ncbi:MAG: TIGR00730 family Rossman fold protein [Alphaproteobacteria bacterium]|nr:TIGR00730 family Rossman fold protein [Alphaproteobacteria bacterium]
MSELRSVCVYCGSAVGRTQAHARSARALGAALAARDIRLVYGGGRIGMMGILADAVLAGGGRVTGVIPEHLESAERAHPDLDEMIVVDSMHTRKRRMFELSDGFVILPGGLGTLDEAFEMITWKQLGLHDKPIVLANIEAYWQPLLDLVRAAAAEGYVRAAHTHLFEMADTVDGILAALRAAPAPQVTPAPERL